MSTAADDFTQRWPRFTKRGSSAARVRRSRYPRTYKRADGKEHKLDYSIVPQEEIDKDMRAAERDAKKLSRKDLVDYYITAMANWNHALNERNRAIREVWRLEDLATVGRASR